MQAARKNQGRLPKEQSFLLTAAGAGGKAWSGMKLSPKNPAFPTEQELPAQGASAEPGSSSMEKQRATRAGQHVDP